jgi:hypothetical protein
MAGEEPMSDLLPPGYDEWRTRSDLDENPPCGIDPDDFDMVKAELEDAKAALRALVEAAEAVLSPDNGLEAISPLRAAIAKARKDVDL